MSEKIAVVYLARPSTGWNYIKSFFESYRKYNAGYGHDLIILCKGFKKHSDFYKLKKYAKEIKYKDKLISDDGFDIHAYLNFAKDSCYEYGLFCNTYSELKAENWLLKMLNFASIPDVGLVGATGSYESLRTSFKLMQKANWLLEVKHVKCTPELLNELGFFVTHLQKSSRKNLLKRIKLFLKNLITKNSIYDEKLNLEFEELWNMSTAKDGVFEWLKDIPIFPNPHIRSTGFLMSMDLLSSLDFFVYNSKEACALFESGNSGLTSKILRMNKKIIVVGANGIGYEINDWEKSNTFRNFSEENIIISDNHVREWLTLSQRDKNVLKTLTWGFNDKKF